MGHRQEPRVDLDWSATLCGVDSQGCSFLERVTIRNMSGRGVLLDATKCEAKIGDTVVLRCGKHHGRFFVKWVVRAQNARCSVGLQHVSASPLLWGVEMPSALPDTYCRPRKASRRSAHRCMAQLSVEVRAQGKAPIWSSTANVSEGGCFVQVLNGLPLFTRVEVALWYGLERSWLEGMVVSSTAGSGIGIKFLSVPDSARQIIRDVIDAAAPIEDRRYGTDAPTWNHHKEAYSQVDEAAPLFQAAYD